MGEFHPLSFFVLHFSHSSSHSSLSPSVFSPPLLSPFLLCHFLTVDCTYKKLLSSCVADHWQVCPVHTTVLSSVPLPYMHSVHFQFIKECFPLYEHCVWIFALTFSLEWILSGSLWSEAAVMWFVADVLVRCTWRQWFASRLPISRSKLASKVCQWSRASMHRTNAAHHSLRYTTLATLLSV